MSSFNRFYPRNTVVVRYQLYVGRLSVNAIYLPIPIPP